MDTLPHIQRTIADLKHPSDFEAIPGIPIIRREQVVAYLRPVPSKLKGQALADSHLMAEWRNFHKGAFFDWITSTENSTGKWLAEKYGPAMDIQTQEEADAYFERCVEHHVRAFSKTGGEITREKAADIERQNLGYYAGYCSHETRERVERLFKCAHPVFGAIKDGAPTPEECFEMGRARGARQETD